MRWVFHRVDQKRSDRSGGGSLTRRGGGSLTRREGGPLRVREGGPLRQGNSCKSAYMLRWSSAEFRWRFRRSRPNRAKGRAFKNPLNLGENTLFARFLMCTSMIFVLVSARGSQSGFLNPKLRTQFKKTGFKGSQVHLQKVYLPNSTLGFLKARPLARLD